MDLFRMPSVQDRKVEIHLEDRTGLERNDDHPTRIVAIRRKSAKKEEAKNESVSAEFIEVVSGQGWTSLMLLLSLSL